MSFQTRKNPCSSSEHKLRFLMKSKSFQPCIDIKGTATFNVQNGSKDIIKIVLVE